MVERFKFISKSKIDALPRTVGIYAFFASPKRNREGGFLYIGKAANIRNRVKNHFQQPSYRDNLFISQVSKIGFAETGSEIEALILESQLIKKYQPKYNVMWKDDKNYFYVAITKENLPRVFITHQAKAQNEKQKSQKNNLKIKTIYMGPFVEGMALKQTLKILRKIFPYYTQKKHPDKLCPWCHLNLCPGPAPDNKEYKKNIKNLCAVLNGKRQSVLRSLKKEMASASKSQNFEKAAKLRDQIAALENIISHAVREAWFLRETRLQRVEAYDVSNIQGKFATGSMVVFINGKPDKSRYRKFKIKIDGKPNDVAMIKEVLTRRFNHPEWPYPDAILIDGGKAQLNAAIAITRNPNFLRRVGAHVERSEMWSKPACRQAGRDKNQIFRVMALAKKHNELFVEGRKNPILLEILPRETFNLILQLRDEAHRFAITYHKKLRAWGLFK